MKSEQKNLVTENKSDYELLDSGENEKLERFGEVLISRPDPQALWEKNLSDSDWGKVHAYFFGDQDKASWEKRKDIPEKWPIEIDGLKFYIKLSKFKHVGIFPEQSENWKWIEEVIKNETSKQESSTKNKEDKKKISVLNLFGYTGGATLAAAKAGAEVCHLDGSKVAITWAKNNAELSGLSEKPIRWILDDAMDFLKREVKRGRKYDGIVMDPPAFGHGPDGQLWKIEKDFLDLLDLCKKVLSDDPIFFIINGYASGYSPIAYKNNLEKLMNEFGGEIEFGELTIKESIHSLNSGRESDRLLPCGIFARWKK